MRRLQSYINKYGNVVGPQLYRALQQSASAASRVARLKKKFGI